MSIIRVKQDAGNPTGGTDEVENPIDKLIIALRGSKKEEQGENKAGKRPAKSFLSMLGALQTTGLPVK